MSETSTTTDPVPNAPSVDPPAPPVPEPAPAPEPVEQTEEERAAEAAKLPPRGDRRFAQLTAQMAAAQRVQAQQAAELEYWRNQHQQQPANDTPEAQHARVVAQIRVEEAAKLRAEQFHSQGRDEYSDWQQRCSSLMSMGADAGFAALLVDMPGGAKVAAALADDPEEVQRIASISSERGRAVALGKYAATVETRPAPRAAPVTRAPAPVRPVSGRASPTFNEYTANAQELADHYFKQNLERQQARK